jgi:hypothetical protein
MHSYSQSGRSSAGELLLRTKEEHTKSPDDRRLIVTGTLAKAGRGSDMRFRRMMVSGMAFWVVAMLHPTSASAQFRLRVEDTAPGGQGVVVSDPLQTGTIFAQFTDPSNITNTVSYTVGEASPVATPVGNQLAILRMQEITVTSTGAATLLLTLEDTGYTDQGNLQVSNHVFNGAWTTGAGGLDSVMTTSFANSSNGVPALGPDAATPAVLASIGAPGGASFSTPSRTFNSADGATFGSAENDYSSDTTAAFTAGSAGYSLWTEVLITFDKAGGTLSFNQDTFTTANAALVGAPEPGSLLLLGTGVVALAGGFRRRKLTRV